MLWRLKKRIAGLVDYAGLIREYLRLIEKVFSGAINRWKNML